MFWCEIFNALFSNEEDDTSRFSSSAPLTNVTSSSSAFYMDSVTTFDKVFCCGYCREGHRGKNNGVLERGVIKYLLDQSEFLREEFKAKHQINDHMLTLKLSLRDNQHFYYKNVQINKNYKKVDSKTIFRKYSWWGQYFVETSNYLIENIINTFDELSNSSTLKYDFKQPWIETFPHNNSESVIDFDPQWSMLYNKISDTSNFVSIKQIDIENNDVLYDSNQKNDKMCRWVRTYIELSPFFI